MRLRVAPRRLARLVLTIVVVAAGCGGSTPGGNDTAVPARAVTLAVSGARVVRAPLTTQTQLLGTTVALRHLTLRAPAAGRITGFELKSGDAIHRGQLVAQVIN